MSGNVDEELQEQATEALTREVERHRQDSWEAFKHLHALYNLPTEQIRHLRKTFLAGFDSGVEAFAHGQDTMTDILIAGLEPAEEPR